MSPTAGGNQARKRRGAGGGTNHGKGNRLNPHDDQQAAWDALLKPAVSEHRLTTTDSRSGIWTWHCECGHISGGWLGRDQALIAWREHMTERTRRGAT